MKLVMTMSKDEIFIRSKNIMNEQKKKSGKSWGGVFGGGSSSSDNGGKAAQKKSQAAAKNGGGGKRKISKNEIGIYIHLNFACNNEKYF